MIMAEQIPATPRPPVDPNIQLPPAVRAQAERAEALQRQLNGEQPPAPQTNGETPVTSEVTPEPKPEPAPISEPPPEDESEQSYEKRYKAMKGRYDKEVPRLKEQINTLVTETNNLRSVMATLEVKAPADEQPPPRVTKSLLTPEEVQDYGEEFFNVVEKKARELIEPIAEQYETRIKGLEQQIKGVGTQVVESAVARMEATLDHDVPDWRDVNTHWEANGFKEWLQLPDPYSGAIRHQLLNAAYERCDTPRVAAFFKGFHAEVAATAPERDVSSPAPAITAAPKVPLTDLAAPGRAKTAAQSVPAEKPIITRAQITQFYNDVVAGRYRGRETEQAQNDQAIFDAQREGRIRN
jgi:hypothetical protein